MIDGATPSMVESSWAFAPFNDFDLDVDTDGNGIARPHRLELDPVTIATAVRGGADEVELGFGWTKCRWYWETSRSPTTVAALL